MLINLEITPDIESTVPDGYKGHCKLVVETATCEKVAVFPRADVALSAANIAVNPNIGGYGSAKVIPTTEGITHVSAVDWLTDDATS